jgi:hypothetical protein
MNIIGKIPCLCPRNTRTQAPVSKSQHRAVRSYDVEKRKSPKTNDVFFSYTKSGKKKFPYVKCTLMFIEISKKEIYFFN